MSAQKCTLALSLTEGRTNVPQQVACIDPSLTGPTLLPARRGPCDSLDCSDEAKTLMLGP
jgi:hypothetical protein